MRAHPSSVLLVLLALGALAAGCKKPGASQAAPPPEPAAVPVAAEDVHVARRASIQTGPRISGSLDPKNRADVRAQAAGSVMQVAGELGQTVKKGHILARIEAQAQGDAVTSAEAALRSAQEDLNVARREVERTDALVQGGALPRRDVDTARSAAVAAEARVGEARARLASARTMLGDATVRAPMDGVISAATVHQGDVVAPGAPLFTIIDPSSMRLEASVPTEDLSQVVVGTPVQFEVRGYPGQTFEGKIERVAPAADPATRQIPILVDIPNPGGKLVAGLFAEGRLSSAAREALVVPLSAVDASGEQPTVTRVAGDLVERVPVQVGLRDTSAEVVEIVSGIAAGDRILLRAARGLTPGTKVVLPGPAPDARPHPRPHPPTRPRPPKATGG